MKYFTNSKNSNGIKMIHFPYLLSSHSLFHKGILVEWRTFMTSQLSSVNVARPKISLSKKNHT